MADKARKKKSIHRQYENDDIIVYWEPRLCIHETECVRGLPQTFDRDARPWINVDTASADDIAATVAACPSGALRFERKDGGPQETPPEQAIVRVMPGGPLHVRGRVRIEEPDETLIRELPRAALCRCGGSQNKPFCDNTHRKLDWDST